MSNIDNLTRAQRHGMSIRPATNGFPYLAEALRLAGVRKNHFDVASGGAVYVMDGGDVYQPGRPMHATPTVLPDFDESALVAAIESDKAGQITFPEFLQHSWAAGVIRYEVDTAARTCTYLGAKSETYVEHYPAVELGHPSPVE